jgi:hypothetical protein
MPTKRLAPLTVHELRYLLKRDPKFRKDLERLRLKLTTSGRIVSPKKTPCVPPAFKVEDDPLILKRGALKSGK